MGHKRKKEREKLNKTAQAATYVRYCFEIAFYAEVRKDIKNAIK